MTALPATQLLRLGTRASSLALAQTRLVAARLATAAGCRTEERTFHTRGDQDRHSPLPAIGGKGVFTEALEHALRAGEINAAVHSLKDLPVEAPQDLVIAAVCLRADARDALVARTGTPLAALPGGAIVGTSSTRRSAQLRALRPDLVTRSIRGNVETRVARVDAGEYDATILAAAGLMRLGLAARITELLDAALVLPAPGQGALAVQCRADDDAVRGQLLAIDEPLTRACTAAERAFLAGLGGGCSLPVAAHASAQDGIILLRGEVTAVDGSVRVRVHGRGAVAEAEALGRRLATEALREGAAALLP